MSARTQRSAEAETYRAWYKTARWQRLRAQQLRQEPLCRRCKREGRITAATVAHHVVAHKGDERLFFDASNLAASCKPCHDTIEQSIERLGYEKGCDADGNPVDPEHPWSKKKRE